MKLNLTILIFFVVGILFLSIATAKKMQYYCSEESTNCFSNGLFYTFRLKTGADLRRSILDLVKQYQLRAASIVTCVGSLQRVNLRLASTVSRDNQSFFLKENEFFEIVSLVGTAETHNNTSYGHFHLSVADQNGNVFGGHLMNGSLIFTTAEITILETNRYEFSREMDQVTSFDELVVKPRITTSSFYSNIQRVIRFFHPWNLVQRMIKLIQVLTSYTGGIH